MLLVAEIMPATSDSVPLIAQYFASTMMIVGLSVVVTVLVLQFHHHDPHGGKMPKLVRIILLNWCAWFLRMKKPGEDNTRRPTCGLNTQTGGGGGGGGGGYKYSHATAPPHHHTSASSIQMTAIPGQASTHSMSTTNTTSTTNGSMNLYFGYHSMGTDNPAFPPGSTDSGVVMCGGGGIGGGVGGGGGGGGSQSGDVHGEHVRTLLMEQVPEISRILEEVHEVLRRPWWTACAWWPSHVFSIICTFTILMSAPNFIEAVSKDFT
ncbi:hypothetical protein CRUP_024469 [Coryphaenoides rupestris]|nr:hypothetical protein CRUP_024469 [Coryphaenoides rupestris]